MRDARVGVLGGGQLGRMMALAAVCNPSLVRPWSRCPGYISTHLIATEHMM